MNQIGYIVRDANHVYPKDIAKYEEHGFEAVYQKPYESVYFVKKTRGDQNKKKQ